MHNWNFKIQKLVEFQYPLLHSPHLSQTSVIVQQQQQLSRKNRIQKIQKKIQKILMCLRVRRYFPWYLYVGTMALFLDLMKTNVYAK